MKWCAVRAAACIARSLCCHLVSVPEKAGCARVSRPAALHCMAWQLSHELAELVCSSCITVWQLGSVHRVALPGICEQLAVPSTECQAWVLQGLGKTIQACPLLTCFVPTSTRELNKGMRDTMHVRLCLRSHPHPLLHHSVIRCPTNATKLLW